MPRDIYRMYQKENGVEVWSGQGESNSAIFSLEGCWTPLVLSTRINLVRVVGFELTTLCSQSRCANQTALHSDYLVPQGRLELPHISALEPKSSASTNSATRAFVYLKN